MKQIGYELFMNDLEALCNKYDVVLFGGCEQEGIYSNVYVIDAKERVTGIKGWVPPKNGSYKFCSDYGVVFDYVGE